MVIGAGADPVIQEDGLKNFVSNVNKQKSAKIDYVSIKDANHKYDKKLKDLFIAIANYLNKRLSSF